MSRATVEASGVSCSLSDYGVSQSTVHVILGDVLNWLKGKDLPWSQSSYIQTFKGPDKREVVEMIFFHYDGPPEREIGGGGENNNCKLYLYSDRMTLHFVGDNKATHCCLSFRYSSEWNKVPERVTVFLIEYIKAKLNEIFDTTPARFNGLDSEVETMKRMVDTMEKAVASSDIMY